MGRMNLADVRTRKSTVNREKLDATTEQDIRRYQAEDGHADFEPPVVIREVRTPREIRVGLGMTQREIAGALHIPLGTWRNWEQGRVSLDPAARSLLEIVSKQPQMVLQALGAEHSDLATKVAYAQLLHSRSNSLISRIIREETKSDLPGPLSALGVPFVEIDQLMYPVGITREDIQAFTEKLQSAVATQLPSHRSAVGQDLVVPKASPRAKRKSVHG